MTLALQQLDVVKPERWITHRMTFTDAQAAYDMLAESPKEALQVILVY
jgi:threonine dehydrogenase-like Zn-dependent dehydrogenase